MTIEKDLTRIADALESMLKALAPVVTTTTEPPKGKARGRAATVTEKEKQAATDAEVVTTTASSPAKTDAASPAPDPGKDAAPAPPSEKEATEDQVKAALQAYRKHKHGDSEDGTKKVQDELEKLVGVRLVKLVKPEDRVKVVKHFTVPV